MEPDDWQPATSRPGELYTAEGQSRARWAFLSGLRRRDPRQRPYRSSMYRVGLAVLGVGLIVCVLVGVVVALLR
jgi:hypothetical protein